MKTPKLPARFVVRPEIQASGFYLHVEDLAGAVIGPFPDAGQAAAYYTEIRERGDSAAFLAIYPGSSPMVNDALEHAMLMTVEKDREPVSTEVLQEHATEVNAIIRKLVPSWDVADIRLIGP